ncbi:MAG: HDOD domain-containing protein, partial [Gallionellaceae bacterium]|nr:HDOD domain-containing protein [Gallionellaceae bacterium]
TILADPALAGRIIKMANSINPNRNRPIASVTVDTLILIGIQATRQAVLALSLVMAYRKGKCKKFDYERFWSHSVATACVAQTIGAVVRTAPLPEIFTCGLLARVGQLGLAAVRPDDDSKLIELYAGKPLMELLQAESDEFGMNHCDLTAAMMADWGMPKLLIDAVYFHYDPAASGFAQGSRGLNLTLTLHLAAQLADLFTAPDQARCALLPPVFETGAMLGLGADDVAAIANHAAQDWLEWGELLNIKAAAMPTLETLDACSPGGAGEQEERGY